MFRKRVTGQEDGQNDERTEKIKDKKEYVDTKNTEQ